MNPAQASRVYASDKACAAICTAMSQNGFRYDAARAKNLGDTLRQQELDAATKMDGIMGYRLTRTKTGGIGTKALHNAVFHELCAPVIRRTATTGLPKLDSEALQSYSASSDETLRELAVTELQRRKARKIRSTYVERIILDPDGRVHPTWNNTGAVTGRFGCGGPNLMNLPRGSSDPTYDDIHFGIRGLYLPSPGCVIVGYDKAQLELRVAAYTTGCPAYIAAISSGDVHSYNAGLVWGTAFTALDKKRDAVLYVKIRTQAKTFIFALNYGAGAEKIYAQCLANGLPVKLREITAILRKLHRKYSVYYQWQEANQINILKTGEVVSPILGRARWLGPDPSPTECYNFPIQAGAADVMNTELPILAAKCAQYFPRIKLLAQVHDAVYADVPADQVKGYMELCEEVSSMKHTFNTSGTTFQESFPIDIKEMERWQ